MIADSQISKARGRLRLVRNQEDPYRIFGRSRARASGLMPGGSNTLIKPQARLARLLFFAMALALQRSVGAVFSRSIRMAPACCLCFALLCSMTKLSTVCKGSAFRSSIERLPFRHSTGVISICPHFSLGRTARTLLRGRIVNDSLTPGHARGGRSRFNIFELRERSGPFA